MREDARQRNEIPWHAWDGFGAEEGEPQEGFLVSRMKKRTKRAKKPKMVTRESQTDSSDEDAQARGVTVAQVHVAPAELPVTTSIATLCVTPRRLCSVKCVFRID